MLIFDSIIFIIIPSKPLHLPFTPRLLDLSEGNIIWILRQTFWWENRDPRCCKDSLPCKSYTHVWSLLERVGICSSVKITSLPILWVCPASRITSLKGLYIIAADGATSFDNTDMLCQIQMMSTYKQYVHTGMTQSVIDVNLFLCQ